ncbi:uncharacterized protein LOC126267070 isoform X2 [Schistocerca gregaria]|uniref:uncharacterized protein LOC126267070 isoform X2 n=1 Tax=Schistocerca gregaria TaxID=7010 RepID=UPI00211F25C8|nr:uncharacterized protein LOC126267070 isoform X2 [Schistocerca gregaria]
MAFKRKFDSDIPDGMLTVLRLLHNPPLEEEILNKVAKGSLHELTPSESSNLWVTLSENLKAYFRNMFLLRDTDNHDDKEYILKKIGAYPFMTTLFFLLKMTIQGKTENSIPLAAAHTMLVLSSMLKKLKTDGQVDNEMLQVSALWTERKLASKENLCFTTFLNRLVHSLRDTATEEDICNVYNLQEWLCISDIRKESCSHIVRAMKSVNYLKSPRGRSFLSFAMTQDEKLMEDLHRSCKSHLSGCSQAESRAYGLIYLEAWRTVSVKKRKHIEEHCIRDLMELAVTLPRKGTEMSPYGLNVLTFLHEFHSRKSCDAIREMLTSQYDLFLWKQLQSSSSNVKCSATEILADAYPLERSRQDIVENNEYLAKQHNVFSDLLVDVNPNVRSVAFRKISQIASKFWAHIPPSVLQHWISTMILRLAKNMETPQVRQSIYQGLHVLVENPNPLCMKILEKMLPELREQIADDDKRVRIAFVKLLHAIKDAGNIELWSIVPLHCLINRLEGSCAFSSVILLSSLMPATLLRKLRIPSNVETVWLSKLDSLSDDDASSEAVHLASFKCLQNYGPKFLLIAANIFRTAIALRKAAITSQNMAFDGKLKKVQYKFESESIAASKILLTAFTALPLPTKNVVQHRKHIYDTWKSMETIKVLVEIRLQQETCVQDPVATDRFIQECFCCYVKLIPALEKTTNFNSMEEYLKLIDWADRILVTRLPMECPYTNERSHFEWLMMNTTGQLTVTLLNQILEALLIMTDKGQICLSLIHKGVRICKKALRTGCRLMFVSSCIKFTSKLYNSFKRNLDARAFFKTQHMLLHLLIDCISSFSDCIPVKDYLKPGLKDYEEIESIVRNVLLSSMKLCGTSAKPITNVVKTFIDVILKVMDREESVVSTSELRDAQDLPFIAARFVALFCSSANLSEVFLVTLMHVISEDCKEAQQMMAGFKLLHILVLCDGYFKHEILTAAIGKAEAVLRCIQSTIFSRTDRDLVEMMETVVKSAKQHLCIHDSNHEISS